MSLPDGSGLDLCRRIRETLKVPVMFLTAADEETDIIMGLDIGADDYITKPFKLAVFLARVNAMLRRGGNFSQPDAERTSNGITLLLTKGEGYKNGKPLELTSSEYRLLCLLWNTRILCSPRSRFWAVCGTATRSILTTRH